MCSRSAAGARHRACGRNLDCSPQHRQQLGRHRHLFRRYFHVYCYPHAAAAVCKTPDQLTVAGQRRWGRGARLLCRRCRPPPAWPAAQRWDGQGWVKALMLVTADQNHRSSYFTRIQKLKGCVARHSLYTRRLQPCRLLLLLQMPHVPFTKQRSSPEKCDALGTWCCVDASVCKEKSEWQRS